MKNYIIRKPEHKKKIIIDPLATSIVDPFEKIKIRKGEISQNRIREESQNWNRKKIERNCRTKGEGRIITIRESISS